MLELRPTNGVSRNENSGARFRAAAFAGLGSSFPQPVKIGVVRTRTTPLPFAVLAPLRVRQVGELGIVRTPHAVYPKCRWNRFR